MHAYYQEYLLSQNFIYGFYVVFYNTNEKPAVIGDNGDIFTITTTRGTKIYCVFINIKPIAPSKKNRLANKK